MKQKNNPRAHHKITPESVEKAARKVVIFYHLGFYLGLYLIIFCSLNILFKLTLIPYQFNIFKHILPHVHYYHFFGYDYLGSAHTIYCVGLFCIGCCILLKVKIDFNFIDIKTFLLRFVGAILFLSLLYFQIVYAIRLDDCHLEENFNRGCIGKEAPKQSLYYNLFYFGMTYLAFWLSFIPIIFSLIRPTLERYGYWDMHEDYRENNKNDILQQELNGGIGIERIKSFLANRNFLK